jgi:LEA14-like dessication related protein
MMQRILLITLSALLPGACAIFQDIDPPKVTVAGVEPLPGEGLELRMMVRLRVQNPNDTPIEYSGIFVNLDVQGRTFASGVSDASGTVPSFGEAVIGVPVTVSMLRVARQVMGMVDGQPVDRIRYDMSGKLGRGAFNSLRFQSQGDFTLPDSSVASGR